MITGLTSAALEVQEAGCEKNKVTLINDAVSPRPDRRGLRTGFGALELRHDGACRPAPRSSRWVARLGSSLRPITPLAAAGILTK
jgi:hypothetical protein